MEILLSAKNISKTFNKKRVLEKINIEIRKAEIVAISGASGAGKTTLLNILSTLDKPDENNSSSLFIDNHEVFDLKKSDLANFRNQKIGFVFQFHELIPELNVIENICLPGWIKKDIDAFDYSKVSEPGNVPARRLSREEYNRTIRDLVGLDLRPADQFPIDFTGSSGFSNSANTL